MPPFSRRTNWNAADNLVSRTAARRTSAGGSLLDLTESNPTRVGLGPEPAELQAALAQATAARYQPDPFGLVELREAVSRCHADRGLQAPVARTAITASTSEAYAYLFKLLGDPGDEVLVPEPSYPLFGYLAGLESIRTVGYPLRYDGEWHLDRDGLLGALSARTRAVVLVNPNNPTGSFLEQDDLDFLVDVAAEHGLALLSDEVFADYALAPGPRRVDSILRTSEVLCFALGGVSKMLALPQLKVGWLVASGPAPVVDEALRRLEVIADTYLSAGTPAQLAAARLLPARERIQAPILARLRQNLATLHALRGPDAPWQPLRIEGGWSAVLRIPRTRTEEEWVVQLVEQDGVLVHPGFFFDFPAEGYLSVSLLPEPDAFRAGMERVARRLTRD